jgi:hypothetical protein
MREFADGRQIYSADGDVIDECMLYDYFKRSTEVAATGPEKLAL